MNKIKKKWFEICLLFLLSFLLLSAIYTVIKEISIKEQISYSLNVDEKEYFTIGYGDYDFRMVPVAKKIQKYCILLQENVLSNVSGQIGYAIRTVDGKELTNGLLDAKNLRATGKIELSVGEAELEPGEEYIIRLYSRISGTVKIALDNSKEPCNKQIFNNTYVQGYYIVLGVIVLILALIVLVMIKFKTKDFFFVFLSLSIGLLLNFVMPPCTAPDEFRHFLRAYTISEGVITCKDYTASEKYYNQTLAECEIPKNVFKVKLLSESSSEFWTSETNSLIFLPEYLYQLTSEEISAEDSIIVPYHGAAGISPVAYLPQVLFICIAKIFKFNALGIYYMARVGNLLCATLLVYFARKICKQYKVLFTLLFFIPGLTFLRSSCSTDGILFGVAVLLIAYLLEINSNSKKSFVSLKNYLNITILLSIIALIKLPYVLLASVLLFFDISKYANKPDESVVAKRIRKITYLCTTVGIACLVYLASNMFLTRYSVSGTSKIAYIEYLFENFLAVFTMLVNTFYNTFIDYMESAFCFPHNKGYFIVYILILTYFGLCRKDDTQEKSKLSAFVFVALGMWMAILGVFYFKGSTPNLGYIWGVQGRYLLPILPVLGIGLSNCNLFGNCENRLVGEKYYYIVTVLAVYILNTYSLYWL